MPERPVMYLEYDDWSPRYEDTFYTVRLGDFELLASPPAATSELPPNHLGGKTNFPAYYYTIKVFCGRHPPRIVYRRYSQFKWLYEKLRNNSNFDSSFPTGGGCFFCAPNTESVAKTRKDELEGFLEVALVKRQNASNDAVAQFLELDSFVSASTN